jgi:hypothetical protein
MGLSRSQLFSLAISDFLKRCQQEEILSRLNEVYANGAEPADSRLLRAIRAKARPAAKERW